MIQNIKGHFPGKAAEIYNLLNSLDLMNSRSFYNSIKEIVKKILSVSVPDPVFDILFIDNELENEHPSFKKTISISFSSFSLILKKDLLSTCLFTSSGVINGKDAIVSRDMFLGDSTLSRVLQEVKSDKIWIKPVGFDAKHSFSILLLVALEEDSILSSDNEFFTDFLLNVVVSTLNDKIRLLLYEIDKDFSYKIFESIQDGISILDKDLNIVLVNPTMKTWYHHALPLEGKKCYEAYQGRSDLCEQCPSIKAIHTKKKAMEIVSWNGKNGEVLGWLELYAFPLINKENGEVELVIEYVRDITEKHNAYIALRESGERFSIVLDIIGEGLFDYDIVQDKFIVSNVFHKIFGYKKGELELSRDSLLKLIKDDSLPQKIESIREKVRERDEPFEIELQIRTKSQGLKWIRVRGRVTKRDENGFPLRIIGSIHDITDVRSILDRLRKSEHYYRNIIESIPIGMQIYELDSSGNLTLKSANPAADDILKIKHAEYIHAKFEVIFPSISDTLIPLIFKNIAKSGTSWFTDGIDLEVKGMKNIFQLTAFQTGYDEVGLAFVDITTQKELEKALELENQRLMEIDKMRKDFISVATHELKTPLSSIKGAADFLVMNFNKLDPKKSFSFIQMIKRGADDLKELINDLLDVSLLDGKRLDLEMVRVDLAEIIKNAIEKSKYILDKRKHELITNIDQNVKTIVDSRRIRQVMINLLTNAAKYTPPRGKIVVTLKKEKHHAIISVKDNGIGLTKKDMKLLFRKFQKIPHPGLLEDVVMRGTGLGLYISKRIVEAHGGDIWAESGGHGEGSVFFFTIPIINKKVDLEKDT
ncbi:MAG: ATP-binding protein [Promethearchaeota archaeon]